jgi:hypothetical protein
MAFNVLFYGLLCHRRYDNTTVFLDAEHHNHLLRMVVRNRDVISKTGFKVDSGETHFAIANEPQTSFYIDGRVLKVEGAKPRRSVFTPDYDAFVPSLQRNSSCDAPKLNPVIPKRKVQKDRVAAYLTHDGGAFSVNDFFAEKCTFTGDKEDARCVARTTRLTLNADKRDVTINDGNGGRIVLRPDAEVRFVNTIPAPFGPMLTNLHFPMYYQSIFDGCHGNSPMEAQIACRHPHDPSFAVGGGDCSNSGDP